MQILSVSEKKHGQNCYGFDWEQKLVKTDTGNYYVHDEWCGQGRIEGECFRTHLYKINDDALPVFIKYINDGYKPSEFCDRVAGISALGRAEKYKFSEKLIAA